MARLRAPEPAGVDVVVPAALTDHGSPVWRDPVAFRVWCLEHLGCLPRCEDRWYARHGAALERWAQQNGFMTTDREFAGLPPRVDYLRLRAVGVTEVPVRRRFTRVDIPGVR